MTKLVSVERGGERLSVHPDALAEHQTLGWALSTSQPTEPAEPEKIDLGTDGGDAFSDEQLRAMIEEASGEKPHHLLGRAKLVERFNELNAKAAGAGE